jgi:hypothetical protein
MHQTARSIVGAAGDAHAFAGMCRSGLTIRSHLLVDGKIIVDSILKRLIAAVAGADPYVVNESLSWVIYQYSTSLARLPVVLRELTVALRVTMRSIERASSPIEADSNWQAWPTFERRRGNLNICRGKGCADEGVARLEMTRKARWKRARRVRSRARGRECSSAARAAPVKQVQTRRVPDSG